jgi:hypothetical protein
VPDVVPNLVLRGWRSVHLVSVVLSPLAVNLFEGHYYELVDDLRAWTAANTTAATYSLLGVRGHLVSITSAAENAFLLSIAGSGWTGATDTAREGTYVWNAGPEFMQNINASGFAAQWKAGSPLAPSTGNTRDCIALEATGWTDVVCTTTLVFIVEYECPLGFEFNATGCTGEIVPSSFRSHHGQIPMHALYSPVEVCGCLKVASFADLYRQRNLY